MSNEKQKGAAKTARAFGKNTIRIIPVETLKKPDWIRVRAGSNATRFGEIKKILREHALHTVCEEAACPNIGECFGNGTAIYARGAVHSAMSATVNRCRQIHRNRCIWRRPSPRCVSNMSSSPASTAMICATAAAAILSSASSKSAPCHRARRLKF